MHPTAIGSYVNYPVQTSGLGELSTNVYELLSLAGTVAGAYHGYKRNRGSIGWAIGWAFLGAAFPVITLPVAIAQGYGKPKA